MAYSDYSQYTALYGGELSEAQFAALQPRAAAMIDTFTFRRAQAAAGYKLEAVKRAECGLVRMLNTQDETGQGLGVESVSNDGYSESYQAAAPTEAQADLKAACFQWLSGTGLMSAI